MARKPNIPCAFCGQPMWAGTGTRPAGESMHRTCQAAQRSGELPTGGCDVKPGCQDCGAICQGLRCNKCSRQQRWSQSCAVRYRDCQICGEVFVSRFGRTCCSARCSEQRLREHNYSKCHLRRVATGASVEPFRKAEIFERDGWRCHICRRKLRSATKYPHPRAATLDHLVPLTRGGSHEPANVKTACLACNVSKGNRGGNEQLLLIG